MLVSQAVSHNLLPTWDRNEMWLLKDRQGGASVGGSRSVQLESAELTVLLPSWVEPKFLREPNVPAAYDLRQS